MLPATLLSFRSPSEVDPFCGFTGVNQCELRHTFVSNLVDYAGRTPASRWQTCMARPLDQFSSISDDPDSQIHQSITFESITCKSITFKSTKRTQGQEL
jgi:hypothetical protein